MHRRPKPVTQKVPDTVHAANNKVHVYLLLAIYMTNGAAVEHSDLRCAS